MSCDFGMLDGRMLCGLFRGGMLRKDDKLYQHVSQHLGDNFQRSSIHELASSPDYHSRYHLLVINMRDSSIISEVNVQPRYDVSIHHVRNSLEVLPVWLEILGNHHSWLNDSGLLWEIGFCKGLLIISSCSYV